MPVSSFAQPVTQRIPLPFASYETRGPRGGVQRLVNCYAEQGQTKGDIMLQGLFGQTLKGQLPTFPQRGAIIFQGKLHVVSGSTLYRINANGGYETLSQAVPGFSYTPMAQNGAQLVIVTNPDAYIWDGTSLTKITDTDFTSRGASDVVFNGNYMVFVEPDSGRFFGSELGDAASYDALDFATAESSPDNLLGLGSDHSDLFLAGEDSCEIWGNVGGTGFPFAKRFNGTVEQGCGAAQSIVQADQTLFWIDETRIARRLDGVTPIRVSQHGVEQAWADYDEIDDAEGFSYTQDGHIFVVWQFPKAGATWVYDATTRQWHERSSYPNAAWRCRWVKNVYGGVWCGDRNSGRYGIIDPATYREYTDDLVMSWTYPSVYAENDRAFHHELDIVCETGTGTLTSPDPQIMLEVSDNGGRSFDHIPTASVGSVGEYRERVTWSGLGSSEDRVYRASISDQVRNRAVYQTHLRVTGGNF